jgi:lysozyme
MGQYIKDFNTFTHLNESIETDPTFVDYIVSVEGLGPGSSPQTGHKAYKDIVGVWTIGYGHAETSEVAPKPKPGMKISDTEAKRILKNDIANAEKKVKTYISTRFPGKSLDQTQLKMLTDYAFNPGLSKFPNFVKAVVNKDWKTASKEYKRYAGVKELTDRNKKFYDLFLAPLLNGQTTKRVPTPEEKKKLEPMNAKPKQIPPSFPMKGKIVYPKILDTEDGGTTKFANVREEPLIDNGWFDNIIRVVEFPNTVGTVIDKTVDAEGMTWYKVYHANDQKGWVRSDVVIDTVQYPYI